MSTATYDCLVDSRDNLIGQYKYQRLDLQDSYLYLTSSCLRFYVNYSGLMYQIFFFAKQKSDNRKSANSI